MRNNEYLKMLICIVVSLVGAIITGLGFDLGLFSIALPGMLCVAFGIICFLLCIDDEF